MTAYVDSSALLKPYVDEADSAAADALLRADAELLTARHTMVEVRRESAASIAETTGMRSLDALHLAAAQRIAAPGLGFLTSDLRQAQAARALGLTVVTA